MQGLSVRIVPGHDSDAHLHTRNKCSNSLGAIDSWEMESGTRATRVREIRVRHFASAEPRRNNFALNP
jgi:hypothetical protein